MFKALLEWWEWLKETFRVLFFPPQPDGVWVGETGLHP